MITAIDPGTTKSALVTIGGENKGFRITEKIILENELIIGLINKFEFCPKMPQLVIEDLQSFGMPIGQEVLQTAVWIGRFYQEFLSCTGTRPIMVFRKQIKLHFCNSLKAKDPNIRAAIIDQFGGKETAIGKKAKPGPLYGVKADEWSALALALYADHITRITHNAQY